MASDNKPSSTKPGPKTFSRSGADVVLQIKNNQPESSSIEKAVQMLEKYRQSNHTAWVVSSHMP
jgi:hypothetical protein